jgi:hypothetical protein
MAPQVGLEPTTDRLTADSSTTELLRNSQHYLFNKAFALSTLYIIKTYNYKVNIILHKDFNHIITEL